MLPTALILTLALFCSTEGRETPVTASEHHIATVHHLSTELKQDDKEPTVKDSLSQKYHDIPAILLAPAGEHPDTTIRKGRKPAKRPGLTLLTVKTNVIPWGATIMNIAGEAGITRNISVSLPVWYCPWFIGEKRALRILSFQPEARWWFANAGEGHFVGIHGSVAWYNMKYGRYRYQDTGRPLLGAGLSYGYSLKFHDSWGIEFSLGAGYLNTRYDRFYNVFNGQLHDTRVTSYLGIDNLSVSFVYIFPLDKR